MLTMIVFSLGPLKCKGLPDGRDIPSNQKYIWGAVFRDNKMRSFNQYLFGTSYVP